MKKYFIIFIFCFHPYFSFSQIDDGLFATIETKVEIESLEFLSTLDKSINNKTRQFCYDTFKVEKTLEKLSVGNPSTHGMNSAAYWAIEEYDKLLNKYYKLLFDSLKKNDQIILKNAQKAWLNFRDEEIKLIALLREDRYSGGGTIQTIIRLSYILSLNKTRVIELFNHYEELNVDY